MTLSRSTFVCVWRDLASQLGFTPARIGAFSLSQSPAHEIIATWLQTDVNSTWRKLIEKMNSAGLKRLALDLRYALIYRVDDII
jgi:hypothetical protein